MPVHDHAPRRSPLIRHAIERERSAMRRMVADLKRRLDRRRKDDGGEPVPVEPNRPLDLSGGAAAALEFDV